MTALICLHWALLPVAAARPAPDDRLEFLRRTEMGAIAGIRGSGGSLAWLGIPYAKPPVGPDRWRPPQPARAWTGIFQADRFGSRCSQRGSATSPGPARVGSEDCLYLNIWSPPASDQSRGRSQPPWPVMVWIHSGANTSRAGSDFDGGKLAVRGDVIVVTINYRLGAFGWFHHPALGRLAESVDEASGNFGTLDQVEALRWVQRHIAAFGGDARNVTVFGESAGGWNILALLASPRASGLFHRAIIQSGNLPFYTPAQASNGRDTPDPGVPKSSTEIHLQLLIGAGMAADRRSARELAARMTDTEVSGFLRGRSFAEFDRAEQAAFADWVRTAALVGQHRYLPGLVRDGMVLPAEGFLELAGRGEIPRMPVLIGSNRDEDIQGLVLYSPQLAQRIAPGVYRFREPGFVALAVEYLGKLWKADGVDEPARLLSQDRPVFVYRHDWDEQQRTNDVTIINGSTAAMHGTQVPLLFGTPSVTLDEPARTGFLELSDATMSYWSQFAREGDPGRGREGRLPRWPAWRPTDGGPPVLLVLDSAAGGGIRTASGSVTVPSVLEEMRRDSRMPELATRCRVYFEIANLPFGANHRMGRLSAADYAVIEGGQCAARHSLSQPVNGAQVPPRGTNFSDCPACPRMVVIPGGTFEMGSASGDSVEPDEQPRHAVRFASSFAFGAHEVTRGQFAAFVAATGHDAGDTCSLLVNGEWRAAAGRSWRNPGFEQDDDNPVVCVSWDDAQAYVVWLSKESGFDYRLPSESEWEYVARAGSADESWPSDERGHDRANYGSEACCAGRREGLDRWEHTSPVGSFPANHFGVFDDRGNAWEWLEDCYHENYDAAPTDGGARTAGCSMPDRRSLRGGSWGDAFSFLRPAYRLRGPIDGRYYTLGFRVARDFGNGR